MKEAAYYEVKDREKKVVQCHLCPNNCIIADGKRGSCRVRENRSGKLYSLVYGKACSIAIDPIEKKPLFHFHPGSNIFSIATVGCNLHCKHCQNWEISQSDEIIGEEISPKEVVQQAIDSGCKSIAYTYTEPTIFFEYMLEIAKLARKKGLKNVTVTNGYINQKPLDELYPYIDATNVDIKGFTEEFYRNVAMAKLQPILNAVKRIKEKHKTWIEITNLVIPTLNDDMKDIKRMCEWILNNLGPDVPLHFSKFFPQYKLSNLHPTPGDTLKKAYEIAKKAGLHYVYVGNMWVEKEENTYCHECNSVVVRRSGFEILENKIKKSKCMNGHKIAGIWD